MKEIAEFWKRFMQKNRCKYNEANRERKREIESERERKEERGIKENNKISPFLSFFASQQNLSHQSAHKSSNCHT